MNIPNCSWISKISIIDDFFNGYIIAYVFNVCIFCIFLCFFVKLDVYFYYSILYFVFVFRSSGLRTITCYNYFLSLIVFYFYVLFYSYCLQFNICGIENRFLFYSCLKWTYNEFIFIISKIIFLKIPNCSWTSLLNMV